MKSVALLIESSRTYGRELLRGVRRFVSQGRDWSMAVELRDLQSSTPAWLRSWRGDGILARTGSRAMASAIASCQVPTVELRSTRWNPSFPFVGIDNAVVGQWCARHLIDRGLQHFAVYELRTETFFEDRSRAFMRAVAAGGFHCHRFHQQGTREKPSQWERQQRLLVQWLETLPRPIGVMACTDQLGCWLLDACRRAGISVPEEVCVIGVENDETLCELSDPPLSSVRLGGERVGFEAAALLDRMMQGRRIGKRPLLLPPIELMARQSSDLVAVNDPLVSRAVRCIRSRACDGLTVEQLAAHLDVSRSTLERQFRRTLHRSPNEQIVLTRLDQAKHLLREGDESLGEIAGKCGLTSAAYLSHRFRLVYGEPPGAYRRRQQGRRPS
ncbi:MAG: DNA-binding transcriptional regulator [Pirellulales bacterium]|nr:DNA-binding transcriptional regulator [Pirellulales bacterium]